MLREDAIEFLCHVSPNSPQDTRRPYDDKRFLTMWCPFHGRRKVVLLVYVTHWGEPWFLCGDGCLDVQGRIESLLATRKPKVESYFTSKGARAVYMARWSLGA